MANATYDLIIIGSGPAGYVAAIRAAQLGLKTALVEKDKTLGGTCLNVGCIPSKAMLDSSEKYEAVQHHYQTHGIESSGVKLNLKQMLARKDGVVKQLTGGISQLMKKNQVEVITGTARLTGETTVNVGKKTLEGKHILLAVGSEPVELPFAKFDGKVVVDSTDALSFAKVPKHMIVIGAGVIGLELGSVWRRLGAEVTLIDVADRPLAIMDGGLGKEALKIFKDQGLKFELGAMVEDVKVTKTGATVSFTDSKDEKRTLKGDRVLVSVGRRANTAKLGLEKVGVTTDKRGTIEVDENYRTNVKTIYAIGDCIPGPMLAHKGEEEGIACVEKIAGEFGHVNYDSIPWVVYTNPEVAGVGLTEEAAKEQKIDYKVGKFNFRANGRALAMEHAAGFVKILADAKTDKLLGCHIIGHNASELIAEVVTVIEFGGSAEDLARTVHAHPTMSEAVKEAALAVAGRAIHS